MVKAVIKRVTAVEQRNAVRNVLRRRRPVSETDKAAFKDRLEQFATPYGSISDAAISSSPESAMLTRWKPSRRMLSMISAFWAVFQSKRDSDLRVSRVGAVRARRQCGFQQCEEYPHEPHFVPGTLDASVANATFGEYFSLNVMGRRPVGS